MGLKNSILWWRFTKNRYAFLSNANKYYNFWHNSGSIATHRGDAMAHICLISVPYTAFTLRSSQQKKKPKKKHRRRRRSGLECVAPRARPNDWAELTFLALSRPFHCRPMLCVCEFVNVADHYFVVSPIFGSEMMKWKYTKYIWNQFIVPFNPK